mgnify:CR=1 FL=1
MITENLQRELYDTLTIDKKILEAMEYSLLSEGKRLRPVLLMAAADAISASRPGARRENIENYVKRLEKLEEISRSFPGIASSYAIQAGREIRIMVKPEEVSEDQMVLLAREIAKKIESEMTYPGQIKVHVLRETKAVDYAK